MANQKKQDFLQGAAILTATVAIVKVIGAIYKIPLGNMLTDEGYGYFQVAYSIYSLLLTLSTAGLPLSLIHIWQTYTTYLSPTPGIFPSDAPHSNPTMQAGQRLNVCLSVPYTGGAELEKR